MVIEFFYSIIDLYVQSLNLVKNFVKDSEKKIDVDQLLFKSSNSQMYIRMLKGNISEFREIFDNLQQNPFGRDKPEPPRRKLQPLNDEVDLLGKSYGNKHNQSLKQNKRQSSGRKSTFLKKQEIYLDAMTFRKKQTVKYKRRRNLVIKSFKHRYGPIFSYHLTEKERREKKKLE